MKRAMDTLKNPAFWMFVAAVVLINTFISPRNLDNWGGFIRVTGIVSVAAFFGKTHCRLLPAILDIFDCSDSRLVCCVDGPDFGTL